MDPYLEDDKFWPAFQHQLIASLYEILLPNLVDRYRARVGQRHYVLEQPLFTSIIREEHHEEFIEVRQRGDNRLVTLVDVVSPANKVHAQSRAAYLERRRDARNQHASVVEIDLVLQGKPVADLPAEGLPDFDYAITVTRSAQPDRPETYAITLPKRLPRFKIPLAPDDRDTVLDMQATFARSYDRGNFVSLIDYRRDPSAPLDDADRKWLHDVLVQQKLR
jgi:hypothetical protein